MIFSEIGRLEPILLFVKIGVDLIIIRLIISVWIQSTHKDELDVGPTQ